jgi:hypothetical protein
MPWDSTGSRQDRSSTGMRSLSRAGSTGAGPTVIGASRRSAEYARFRLDPGTSEVSFTARSTDGPVEVMGVLKKLEALVEHVNREAIRVATAPAPQETPAEGAKAPVSGLAARLGFKGRGRP